MWRIGWALLGAVLKTRVRLITAIFKIVWDVFVGIFTVGLGPADRPVGQSLARHAERVRQVWNAMTAVPADDLGAWHGFLGSSLSAMTGLWRSAWAHGQRREVLDRRDDRADPGLEAVVKAIRAAFQAAIARVV